jgi:glyceraldehyde 3-phosphate dehydrogenase
MDFSVMLKKPVSVKEINAVLQKYSQKYKNIMEYSEDELVSRDIINNPHSCIIDSLSTQIIEDKNGKGNLAKVLAWYDNEFGYSNRLVDVVEML